MLTELEKYELVNSCETIESLSKAILTISNENAGIMEGRSRNFDGEKMASYVENIVKGDLSPNLLTRRYGIRQQALYIKFYK